MNLKPRWSFRNEEIQKRGGWLPAQSIFPCFHRRLGRWNIFTVRLSSERKIMEKRCISACPYQEVTEKNPQCHTSTLFPSTARTTGSETHFTAVYQNITSCCSSLTVDHFNLQFKTLSHPVLQSANIWENKPKTHYSDSVSARGRTGALDQRPWPTVASPPCSQIYSCLLSSVPDGQLRNTDRPIPEHWHIKGIWASL